eukprot:CAMPEP_0179854200 /NCGR_PEP_ID=MMETSP0982-20121206/9798_1 /TAXON_ID=483367 /ORGANISM="non described non described, Strain CCMP 2436" /LENGTH=71 /DNA_ID=CAMNT_0021740053 /DNA_START=328 /DNA_END=539 /DNA_ORIENTATION=+
MAARGRGARTWPAARRRMRHQRARSTRAPGSAAASRELRSSTRQLLTRSAAQHAGTPSSRHARSPQPQQGT